MYGAHEHVTVSVPDAYSLQLVKVVRLLWVLPAVDTAQQRHGSNITLAFPLLLCCFCMVRANAYNVDNKMQVCELFREQFLAFDGRSST